MKPDDQVITITSTPVVAVQGSATLRQAAERLDAANVGALVILGKDPRPVAVISERDVVRAIAEGADPDEVWVADVAHEEPRYATPGASIRAIGLEMVASGVRHLPVMEEGEVIGMVSARDVMSVLAAPPPTLASSIPYDGGAVLRELAHPGG